MATMWKHKPDFFVIPIFHCRQPFLRLLYCDASMIVENICCQGSVLGYEFYFRSKGDPDSAKVKGQISRELAKLRAHGLIRKVPHSRRYLVSGKGRRVMGALIESKRKIYPELAAE